MTLKPLSAMTDMLVLTDHSHQVVPFLRNAFNLAGTVKSKLSL